MKFSMILSNNLRSYEYLKLLIKNQKYPKYIIYLDYKNNNKLKKKIFSIIKKEKIKYKSFKANNIDKILIKKFLLNLKEKIIVYSGYAGKIVKSKNIFKQKMLLHSHSGKLPYYKGSTTIYYSLIQEKKIYCSTFVMNSNIDEGKILLIKRYPLIKNYKNLDNYDNKIRAKNILETLDNFSFLMSRRKRFNNNFSPYYIIHPILRYIALKK